MKLSLVVPCYNEEENIALFADTAERALDGVEYEIIFINDCILFNSDYFYRFPRYVTTKILRNKRLLILIISLLF